MASGGIRDHIGGGFHRYAVDRAWRVPHFEKMLCDQAQLAVTYCEAWQITGDPPFLDVARDTLEYVLRELTHPEGGFFSAVDAESLVAHGGARQAEGAFYLWTAPDSELNNARGASRGLPHDGRTQSKESAVELSNDHPLRRIEEALDLDFRASGGREMLWYQRQRFRRSSRDHEDDVVAGLWTTCVAKES
jgi:mannose/cellobiose epimerase-like protein (N-acyl-D-glucosamine 2-epimerase family)